MVKKLRNTFKAVELLVLFAVLLLTGGVTGKYIYKDALVYIEKLQTSLHQGKIRAEKAQYRCPVDLHTVIVQNGKVCRGDVPDSIYRTIFDTYPFYSNGVDELYSFISKGSLGDADKIIVNNVPIERYGDFDISSGITWNENYKNDKYWRFLFYGFRPYTDLFYAHNATNDAKYLLKMKEVTESFLNNAHEKQFVWDDFHAVSFRSMFLVKTWWSLRENNLLDYEFSEKLLKGIETHAEFLADPNHYDKGFNHALNQAAALYQIAAVFPDFVHSISWLELAKERLSIGLNTIVDEDGVLSENSPYYHFYVLEKYWELHTYVKKTHISLGADFEEKLQKMITYAQFIIEPDGSVPLTGASQERTISNFGIYREISGEYPEFRYVLSRGKYGKKPQQLNKVFESSGEVIMRSGWGTKDTYKDQVQVLMDAGPYRTAHSDLNALSFSLFAQGINVITDSGLYTYDAGIMKDYFHGTSAHNTVTVDGKNQKPGTATRTHFVEKQGYVSQSATHTLYDGVEHKRTIALVQDKYIVIIDTLVSDTDHSYSQNFHLFPGAIIQQKENRLLVKKSDSENQVMTIHQVGPETPQLTTNIGQVDPPSGICSLRFGEYVPCYSLQYTKTGSNQQFITLLQLGETDKRLRTSYTKNVLTFTDSWNSYSLDITQIAGKDEAITVERSPNNVDIDTNNILSTKKIWTNERPNVGSVTQQGNGALVLKPSATGASSTISLPITLDLSDQNLYVRLKIDQRQSLADLDLLVSSQTGSISADLKNAYREAYNNDWLVLSLGKSDVRKTAGAWSQSAEGFDWKSVNKLSVTFESMPRLESTIEISHITHNKNNSDASVILVFDDGYESILPAAEYMKSFGYSGNVAIIADRVISNQRLYLSLEQIKKLQNVDGWNIVNHSQRHVDAVREYVPEKRFEDFEKDILGGLKFLEANTINSAPNWYIYPHGATNSPLKSIVSKYYQFARTTTNGPETYPFGEPYHIRTISADSSYDTGEQAFTPVKQLTDAITDAKQYNQPLFITFHRINSRTSDRPGYPLEDFKKVIQYIQKTEIPVKTLSQFDADNGVSLSKVSITAGIASRQEVSFTKQINSPFVLTQNLIENSGIWLQKTITPLIEFVTSFL